MEMASVTKSKQSFKAKNQPSVFSRRDDIVTNHRSPVRRDRSNDRHPLLHRIVMRVNGNTATVFGCDQTELCKNEGCFSSYGDSQVCCCSKDQCNSSSKLSALLALFPVFLLKFF
ncbi:hypothetical protein ANCCAN_07639 [Ancylostoma caninum]|uniref:ET module n=1 Tax=Ancylostoma caninum TaxID=29170 RepID=A0A368GTM7_ANCCA|nr:hypothetical protein ANCCAN_07639 [Ancylostoma caninum]